MQRIRQRLLLLITAFALGVYMAVPVYDPDLGWHLVIGRWILAHHAVPHEDLWTVIGQGKHWIAYSWLVEILFAWIYSWMGQNGLLVLTILVMSALSLSLITLFTSLSKSSFRGYFLGILVTFSFVNHFTLRPQSITWIYFTLALYAASLIRERPSGIRIGALMAIFAVWSNSHISANLGIFAVFCIFAEEVWNSPAPRLAQKQFIKIMVLCLLATLLTPYFGEEWIVAYVTSSHPMQFTTIREFAPANILQYCSAFLLLLIFLYVAVSIQTRARPKLWHLLGFGSFVLAGLVVIKFMPLALIFGGFLIAEALNIENDKPSIHLLESFSKLEIVIRKIPVAAGVALCLVSAVYNGYFLLKNQGNHKKTGCERTSSEDQGRAAATTFN